MGVIAILSAGLFLYRHLRDDTELEEPDTEVDYEEEPAVE
jgi:hypothetical protein